MGRDADEVLKDALELPAGARSALVDSLWQAEILRGAREIDDGSVQIARWSELRSC
jgi:hypothetical protein